jgi:hypothetical protein
MDYRITFRVSQNHLQTIFGALANEKNIALESVEPIKSDASPSPRQYHGGQRFKGIKGHDLIMELVKKGPATRDQIAQAFSDRGFAVSSFSAAISTAIHKNLIVVSGNGYKAK